MSNVDEPATSSNSEQTVNTMDLSQAAGSINSAGATQQPEFTQTEERNEPASLSSSTETPKVAKSKSFGKRKRKNSDQDEMDQAIFDKIMGAKKICPIAQTVDETMDKLREKGLDAEVIQFRRPINYIIDEFEEKML